MYAFESSPRGKHFHFLMVGCFVLVLLLFGISGMDGVAYPFIYQTTAIILMTVGVYFMARYVLRIYRYEISQSGITAADGTSLLDLVITEIIGHKKRVVTRVAVRDIEGVLILSRKEYKAKVAEIAEGKTVYRYTNRPFEPISCYLLLPEENAVVAIPVDEQMMRYLRQFCAVSPKGDRI